MPADLLPALDDQLDLQPVLSGHRHHRLRQRRLGAPAGRGAGSRRARRSRSRRRRPPRPGRRSSRARCPSCPAPAASRSFQGPLTTGTVFSSAAPSGDWSLTLASGATATRSASFGWASRYAVPATTTATLHFDGGVLPLLAGVFSVVVWGLALAALVDRRRLRREWERVGRPRAWSPGRTRQPRDARRRLGPWTRRCSDERPGSRSVGCRRPGGRRGGTGSGRCPTGRRPARWSSRGSPVGASAPAPGGRPDGGHRGRGRSSSAWASCHWPSPLPSPAAAAPIGGRHAAWRPPTPRPRRCSARRGAGRGRRGRRHRGGRAHQHHPVTVAHGVMTVVAGSGSARGAQRRGGAGPRDGRRDAGQGAARPAPPPPRFSFAGGGVTGTMVVGGPDRLEHGAVRLHRVAAVGLRRGLDGHRAPRPLALQPDGGPGRGRRQLPDRRAGTSSCPRPTRASPSPRAAGGGRARRLRAEPGRRWRRWSRPSSGAVVATELDRIVASVRVGPGTGVRHAAIRPPPGGSPRRPRSRAAPSRWSVANPGQSAVTAEVSVGLSARHGDAPAARPWPAARCGHPDRVGGRRLAARVARTR